jgi:hypothetical protein
MLPADLGSRGDSGRKKESIIVKAMMPRRQKNGGGCGRKSAQLFYAQYVETKKIYFRTNCRPHQIFRHKKREKKVIFERKQSEVESLIVFDYERVIKEHADPMVNRFCESCPNDIIYIIPESISTPDRYYFCFFMSKKQIPLAKHIIGNLASFHSATWYPPI